MVQPLTTSCSALHWSQIGKQKSIVPPIYAQNSPEPSKPSIKPRHPPRHLTQLPPKPQQRRTMSIKIHPFTTQHLMIHLPLHPLHAKPQPFLLLPPLHHPLYTHRQLDPRPPLIPRRLRHKRQHHPRDAGLIWHPGVPEAQVADHQTPPFDGRLHRRTVLCALS